MSFISSARAWTSSLVIFLLVLCESLRALLISPLSSFALCGFRVQAGLLHSSNVLPMGLSRNYGKMRTMGQQWHLGFGKGKSRHILHPFFQLHCHCCCCCSCYCRCWWFYRWSSCSRCYIGCGCCCYGCWHSDWCPYTCMILLVVWVATLCFMAQSFKFLYMTFLAWFCAMYSLTLLVNSQHSLK